MGLLSQVFDLSTGSILGLMFLGYIIINFLMFALDALFRLIAWGFHSFLSHISTDPSDKGSLSDSLSRFPDDGSGL